ncbi:MAG TPA: hypothetical protein ACFE0H_05620 [Elainellaceae cyanobacterium]
MKTAFAKPIVVGLAFLGLVSPFALVACGGADTGTEEAPEEVPAGEEEAPEEAPAE